MSSSHRRHSSNGVRFVNSRVEFRDAIERDHETAIRRLERRERELIERERDVRARERMLRDGVTPMRRPRALSQVMSPALGMPGTSMVPSVPLPARQYPAYAGAAYQQQIMPQVVPVPVPVPMQSAGYLPGSTSSPPQMHYPAFTGYDGRPHMLRRSSWSDADFRQNPRDLRGWEHGQRYRGSDFGVPFGR